MPSTSPHHGFRTLLLVLAMMTQLDGTRNAVWILPLWIGLLYAGYRIAGLHRQHRQPEGPRTRLDANPESAASNGSQ